MLLLMIAVESTVCCDRAVDTNYSARASRKRVSTETKNDDVTFSGQMINNENKRARYRRDCHDVTSLIYVNRYTTLTPNAKYVRR